MAYQLLPIHHFTLSHDPNKSKLILQGVAKIQEGFSEKK